MTSSKKIKFSSSFDIKSESFREKVVNHDTGTTRVVDNQNPIHSTRQFTLTTNPVKWESKDSNKPKQTSGYSIQVNPHTVGYDTSQLTD